MRTIFKECQKVGVLVAGARRIDGSIDWVKWWWLWSTTLGLQGYATWLSRLKPWQNASWTSVSIGSAAGQWSLIKWRNRQIKQRDKS